MYPHAELIRLSAQKAAIRREIAAGRMRCATAAARVVQPLMWIDGAVSLVRRVAGRALGAMRRWGPLVFTIGRGVRFRRGGP